MAELPDYLREFDDTAKTRQLIYDGCLEAVKNRFPVEDDTYRLELADVHYDGPQDYSLEDQKQALMKSKNLRTPMKGRWRLIHKPTNTVLGEREDTILQVPYYTDRGTIINNGNDYSIISQMRLRPGVYARRRRTGELESHFNIKSGTGRAFRFELEPESGAFKLTVGQSHVPLYPILKAIGVTDQDMMKYWGADIVAANAKQSDAQALKKTYQRMAGAKADDNANQLAMGQFIKDAIEKYQVDPEIVARTMGIETDHVTPELMLRATQKLLDINRGDAQPDNRDNPRYASVYSIEDLMRERIDKDAGRLTKSLLYKVRRDRSLNRLPKNALTPYLDSFILGSGLTMPGEETNPLSNLTQMNRISRFGEGGIRSDDAVPMEAHDVHGDWMGFVDPVAGPEGLRIGVDVRASYRTFKGKDKKLYGEFINARTGKEEFVDMGTAADRVVAFPGQDMSQPYVFAMKDDVPTKVKTDTVDYVVPSFAHLYGTNTNINPMPTAVQAGRQFYGSKFWEQYLPQVKGEVPLVDSLMPDGKTTFTEFYGRRIGTLRSSVDGTVVSVKDNEIVVKDGTGKKHKTTLVSGLPFNRISSISYTPSVKVGQDVHKGDMLANSNYTDAKTGAINMGQNLRVAILPYKGQSVSGDTNVLWRYGVGNVSFGPIKNIVPGDGMASLTVDPKTLEQSYAKCNALMIHKPDTKMYLVKTLHGRQVKVTGSHSMMVYDGKLGIKELKTTDLIPGQHFLPVVPPKIPFGESDSIICKSSTKSLEVKLDRDFGWLIGIFLSEGYVDTHSGSKVIDISCTENDIVANLRRICTDLGVRHGYSEYKSVVRGKEHTQGRFKIYCSSLATWINDHCGKGAEHKYLPDVTWTAPKEFAEGLIDAYICGDGSIGKECRISTVSHQMAEGLCFLMGGLGIMATYRTQKARSNWKPEIIVRIYREFCHLLPDITLKRKDKAAKKLAVATSKTSYDSVPIPESHYNREFRKMASSRSRIRRINNCKDETLTKLCDIQMWWDMVDEVLPIPSEDYVYDLDMQPTSTFVVNTGIVVHNSFEDAHVISESAAKKMATDRMYSTDVETRNGVVANKNKYIAAFPNKFTKQQFETLDEDGMAKVGTELHKGDPIVVAIGPKVLSSSDTMLGKLSKTLRNAFTDKAEVWEHDWPGVVTDAVMTSRGARVNVKTTPPVKVGDKLCYSDDTQVLTENGWKNIADLTLEDKVCTLNPDNRIFEYVNPAQLEKYEHDGKMYSIRSKHIDLMVTLDHNMYVDIGEGFRFYKAEDIVGKKAKYLKAGLNGNMVDETESVLRVASWGDPAYVGCRYAADKLQQDYLHAGMAADVVYDGFKYKVTKSDGDAWVNEDTEAPEDMVVDYDGYVYCCTMPKWHIIYVRRNGKACWSGNSGRFGLKGVVGKICSQEEMPRDAATNEPYDMLVNPMGFLSRVAPGQLMEIALGKVAKHTGQQIRLPQLPPPEGWATWTQSQLDKYGLKDSTDIFDPETGKTIKNVGDGYMFVSAFHHLAEKKTSSRGTEASYTQDDQPAKGGSEGAKRVSGLDLFSLLAHGATDVIKDYVTIRGTNNQAYWNALRLGLPIPEPGVPFIYNKFLNTLKAGGINVVEKGNITQILPLTDKDIDTLAGQRLITSSAMVDSDLEPVKGGLFDPGKTGGANGNFWSAIPLPEPVPNPIMEEPIRRVLGMTVKKLEAVLSGEEQLNGKTGGEAIKEALSHVDIDDKIAQARLDIKNRRGSIRDNAVKVLGYLTSMKEQGLKPSDWMISKVPVLPPKFRPASKLGDVIMVSDINDLYKEVIENAKNFEELHKDLPDSATTTERLNLYRSVKAAYGLGESITPEGQAKGLKGAIRQVIGSQPKCYDSETELLTKRGWVKFPEVTIDDTVATVNQDTLQMEWDKPQDVIHQDYNGLMVHTTSKKLDLLVTPNHKHLVEFRRKTSGNDAFGRAHKVDAAELVYSGNRAHMFNAPAAKTYGTTPRLDFGDMTFKDPIALAFFVGMYVAEGWVHNYGGQLTYICQTTANPEVVDEIDRITERLGNVQRTEYRGGYSIYWSVQSKEFRKWIIDNCGDVSTNKFLSAEILEWRSEYLREVYRGYMLGDGEKRGNVSDTPETNTTFFHRDSLTNINRALTASKRLVDTFSVLCMELGFGFRYDLVENSKKNVNWHDAYRMSAYGWNRVVVEGRKYHSWEHYTGQVHCVTVPNGLLVVRRSGKTAVSGNSGMFQRKVISKTVDTVSRGVIIPDPNLDMDQLGIPEEHAWQMYKPFVMRALVRRGYPPVTAIQMLDKRDATARQMLEEEMEKRPVLMDRAPTWHKFNIMAFRPHIVEGDSIHVCPLCDAPMNGDHDGDAVNLHVPVSDKAVKNALDKMLPSENLTSLTDLRTPRYVVSKEQILGLFNLTQPENNKPVKIFRTKDEAKMAYARGEIDMNDPIEILQK